jgi:hypothetical protein
MDANKLAAFSDRVEEITQRGLTAGAINATYEACLGALILSAGRKIQMASLGSFALMNWTHQGQTKVRPLNSAIEVAMLLLAGFGGKYLYQGFKALPRLNALGQIGIGLTAFAARYSLRLFVAKLAISASLSQGSNFDVRDPTKRQPRRRR